MKGIGKGEARCSPGEDGAEGPYVWRHKLPHKSHPFKQNVWDIEYGQEPLVLCIALVKVFAHAGGVCIANVAAIERGQKIFAGPLSL
jgi:hypothetical protein